jgi:signal transduction histidine kinase
MVLEWIAAAAAVVVAFFLGRVQRRASAIADEPSRDLSEVQPDSRFEQLLRSLTVGIVTVDGRGRLDSINAAAGAIFEVGARPVLGRAIIEVVPSFELDRRVREALDGQPSRGRISLNRPAGTRVLTVATLPLDGSRGALVIASDETRPLSSINLMIETILDNDGDIEAIDIFLPRIKQEVDRMVQLVQDLLELARAESGQLRLRRETVDLASVGNNIKRTFEPRAEQLGVALTFEGDETPISGDADRLAQVFVNLIDNALRHTPAGGKIVVSVSGHDGGASLVVRDSGVGIPYNDLPHVFERFYVVDRSRARESTGTGLGLSIVKQVVEAHGGTVTADSEYGLGATFTCVFPTVRSLAMA